MDGSKGFPLPPACASSSAGILSISNLLGALHSHDGCGVGFACCLEHAPRITNQGPSDSALLAVKLQHASRSPTAQLVPPSGRCVGWGETPPSNPVQPLVCPFPARLPVIAAGSPHTRYAGLVSLPGHLCGSLSWHITTWTLMQQLPCGVLGWSIDWPALLGISSGTLSASARHSWRAMMEISTALMGSRLMNPTPETALLGPRSVGLSCLSSPWGLGVFGSSSEAGKRDIAAVCQGNIQGQRVQRAPENLQTGQSNPSTGWTSQKRHAALEVTTGVSPWDIPALLYRSAGQTELNSTVNNVKHYRLVLQTAAWNGRRRGVTYAAARTAINYPWTRREPRGVVLASS
jgi:hypothetical protein